MYLYEIDNIAKKLKIKGFQGIFMKDEINKLLPLRNNKCFIFNLQRTDEQGSHWVCCFKKENILYYFDSYGVRPPVYLGKSYFNTFRIQTENDGCGIYCIIVLYECMNKNKNFIDILLNLYNNADRNSTAKTKSKHIIKDTE